MRILLALLLFACTPRELPDTTPRSATHVALSQAGISLGFSDFRGDALGNLLLGQTTFATFCIFFTGNTLQTQEPYFVFEYPLREQAQSELRRIWFRFDDPVFPPAGSATLQSIRLDLSAPPEAIDAILQRLGGSFREQTLPTGLNRYGELALVHYVSESFPYEVDVDRTGIRVLVTRRDSE